MILETAIFKVEAARICGIAIRLVISRNVDCGHADTQRVLRVLADFVEYFKRDRVLRRMFASDFLELNLEWLVASLTTKDDRIATEPLRLRTEEMKAKLGTIGFLL